MPDIYTPDDRRQTKEIFMQSYTQIMGSLRDNKEIKLPDGSTRMGLDSKGAPGTSSERDASLFAPGKELNNISAGQQMLDDVLMIARDQAAKQGPGVQAMVADIEKTYRETDPARLPADPVFNIQASDRDLVLNGAGALKQYAANLDKAYMKAMADKLNNAAITGNTPAVPPAPVFPPVPELKASPLQPQERKPLLVPPQLGETRPPAPQMMGNPFRPQEPQALTPQPQAKPIGPAQPKNPFSSPELEWMPVKPRIKPTEVTPVLPEAKKGDSTDWLPGIEANRENQKNAPVKIDVDRFKALLAEQDLLPERWKEPNIRELPGVNLRDEGQIKQLPTEEEMQKMREERVKQQQENNKGAPNIGGSSIAENPDNGLKGAPTKQAQTGPTPPR